LGEARRVLEEFGTASARMSIPLEYRQAVWSRFDTMRMAVDDHSDADGVHPEIVRDLREDIIVVRALTRGRPLDVRRWKARADTFNRLFEQVNQLLIQAAKGNHLLGSPVGDHGPSLLQAGEEALGWFRARDLFPGLRLSLAAAERLLERLREAINQLPEPVAHEAPFSFPHECQCGHDHTHSDPKHGWVKSVVCPVPGCQCKLA
jgi:hypothetical protein